MARLMTDMLTGASTQVRVELGSHGYDILIRAGALTDPSSYGGLPPATRAVIVTNDKVGPLYADALERTLSPLFPRVQRIVLPDGEEHKNWETLERIFDAMLAEEADRKAMVFALGGGVIGDMAGFAAASYMRGVPFVQVPTTLLAQIDSSVGGKTAINHPRGKNMIGAFYQPQRVVADITTLDTLPERELKAGLAEAIKYGPIYDAAFLDWIEAHLDRLLTRDPEALVHLIRRSCEIKAEVVAADERETGLRAILNFGHTFGHAIETGLGYGVWLHGEGVACGMVLAADLSARLGLIPEAQAQRLGALIARAGLPVTPPDLGVARFLDLMRVDKKAEGGHVRFVLLDGPGHALLRPVPEALVAEVLADHGVH